MHPFDKTTDISFRPIKHPSFKSRPNSGDKLDIPRFVNENAEKIISEIIKKSGSIERFPGTPSTLDKVVKTEIISGGPVLNHNQLPTTIEFSIHYLLSNPPFLSDLVMIYTHVYEIFPLTRPNQKFFQFYPKKFSGGFY